MKKTINTFLVITLVFTTISIFAASETRLPDGDAQPNGWVTAPLFSKINAIGGDFITGTDQTVGEVTMEDPTNAGTYSSVSLEIIARNGGNAANIDLWADIRINGALQGVQEVTDNLPKGGGIWGTYVLTWPGLSFDETEMGTLQVLFYTTSNPAGNPQHSPQIDFIEATLTYDVATDDADLAITKTASPTPHFFGSNVTFTVTVTNNGPGDATLVEAVDLLGSGFAYVSHIASQGTFDDANGDWDIGDIDEGDSVTLTLVATILNTGVYENFAEITFAEENDPVGINNEVLLTIFPTDPPPVPLSNWALFIGLGLIVSFLVIRFRSLT